MKKNLQTFGVILTITMVQKNNLHFIDNFEIQRISNT